MHAVSISVCERVCLDVTLGLCERDRERESERARKRDRECVCVHCAGGFTARANQIERKLSTNLHTYALYISVPLSSMIVITNSFIGREGGRWREREREKTNKCLYCIHIT